MKNRQTIPGTPEYTIDLLKACRVFLTCTCETTGSLEWIYQLQRRSLTDELTAEIARVTAAREKSICPACGGPTHRRDDDRHVCNNENECGWTYPTSYTPQEAADGFADVQFENFCDGLADTACGTRRTIASLIERALDNHGEYINTDWQAMADLARHLRQSIKKTV